MKEWKESRKSGMFLNDIKLHFFRPTWEVKLYHTKFCALSDIFLLAFKECFPWFKHIKGRKERGGSTKPNEIMLKFFHKSSLANEVYT